MARTVQGRRLTEQHRQEQVRLRSRFLSALLPLWPLLDWARIDDTAPGWVQAVMGLVRPFRQESADLAVSYYREFRQAEVPNAVDPAPEVEFVQSTAPRPRASTALLEELDRRRRLASQPAPARAPEPSPRPRPREELVKPRIDWSEWDKATERSLLVTGPGELKRQSRRGVLEVNARRTALVTSSGAAGRHVLAGGRQANFTLIQNDKTALGWVRVTDSDPCAFCAMLASRGITFRPYRQGAFDASNARFDGPGTAKVHDNCACQLEPVYSRNTALPGRAGEFRALWEANIAGKYSGRDALNAWRRLLDAQRREQGLPRPLTA